MSTSVLRSVRVVFGAMALVVFSAAFSTASAGVKVIDKNVPAEESFILYFDKDITVSQIDGKNAGGAGGGVVTVGKTFVEGKGSKKKPSALLQIPAGERKIQAEFVNYGKKETTFEFQAGRHYQLIIELGDKSESTGGKLGNALIGNYDYKWEFKDITDTVKK